MQKTFLNKLIMAALLAVPLYATAQLNGLFKKLGGNNLNAQLTQKFGEAVGVGSPLLLDQNNSYPTVPAPNGFNPHKLSSMDDLVRPLPPGDYSVDTVFYCTQWSIHAPGQGNPYKLGPATGRLAKPICALLYRGTLMNIAASTLNADAWRIQAGVPLKSFPPSDKKLIHRLIPEYESTLQGDWFEKLKSSYDSSLGLLTHKPFDAMLATMGAPGQTLLNVEKSRAVLQDQTQKSERVPEMLYQQTGQGGAYQLPPDRDHPSPWVQIKPGVIARFTDISGNLNTNLLEFRVLPGAGLHASRSDGSYLASNLAPFHHRFLARNCHSLQTQRNTKTSSGSVNLAGLLGGEDGSVGTVGYPIGHGAQCPIVEPIISGSTSAPSDHPADVSFWWFVDSMHVVQVHSGGPAPQRYSWHQGDLGRKGAMVLASLRRQPYGRDEWVYTDYIGFYTKTVNQTATAARYLLSTDGKSNDAGYVDAKIIGGKIGPPLVYPVTIVMNWHGKLPGGILVGGTSAIVVRSGNENGDYINYINWKLTCPNSNGGPPVGVEMNVAYNMQNGQKSCHMSVHATTEGTPVAIFADFIPNPDKSINMTTNVVMDQGGGTQTATGNINFNPDGSGSGTITSTEHTTQENISFTKDGQYTESYQDGASHSYQLPIQ